MKTRQTPDSMLKIHHQIKFIFNLSQNSYVKNKVNLIKKGH